MMSIAALALLAPFTQDPAAGIDRELARERRARIDKVRYELSFDLTASEDTVRGKATVWFELSDTDNPVVLDFDGESLTTIRFNGKSTGVTRRINGHIVVPADTVWKGLNWFEAEFSSKVASTGTPLTRYRDKSDGKDYFYTLVVPADAHRLFPCFDQPDLKGTFDLQLKLPAGWHAIANGEQIADAATADQRTVTFAQTKPLPTYLFAFAAGPFARVTDSVPTGPRTDSSRRMQLYVRESKLADLERDRLFEMHRASLKWLGTYFDFEYPFGKLDLVLVPGFPYGGMEHAGAIFYREASLVFDHAPTESELIRRSTLIYHEVSHQWFGNLVTMEWFDDLWLKEGFATFVGYTLLDVLEPGKNAWLRFHQRVKPRAYAVDGTRGTTPIYQQLQNLADAKSAYGAIVYNKAPAVLRELHARLGPEVFRRGVQIFLRKHAFANARWQDLAAALREASGQDNSIWSDRWILSPGMPRISVDWKVDASSGNITEFEVRQTSVQGSSTLWPLSLEALLIDGTDKPRRAKIDLDGERGSAAALIGTPAPRCVVVNPRDIAYGLFVLDPRSRDWICEHAQELDDLLLRATAISALWNTVREAELDPRQYARVALRLIEHERDPETHSWLLGTLRTTIGRYLPNDESDAINRRIAQLLTGQLRAGLPGLELQTVRFLARTCSGAEVHELMRGLLDGSREITGLSLGRRDRFLVAASLLAAGDPKPLETEIARFAGVDCAKEIYLARAAAPDAATKQRYFDSYDELGEPPEQWMQDSLGYFHWPGQSELTAPFLRPALERVEWVKANRRIFFMPAWIQGFVNAHSTPEALETVRAALERDDLPTDIRRKILQSVDGLERAVRIRARFG